jgi:hypothetical protein
MYRAREAILMTTLLADAMDRLVPPIDDLPGAGTLGLAADVEQLAARHPPYQRALRTFLDTLGTRWSADLPDAEKDAVLKDLEQADAAAFGAVLELVYLAYYGDARVHQRVGWRGGPLQPAGFALPPFDPEILHTARRRKPFWRLTEG